MRLATHVITLLAENEDAHIIGSAAAAAAVLDWEWVPMIGGGAVRPDTEDAVVRAALERRCVLLTSDRAPRPRLYIHCSAGVHRTGMFTYALLRFAGIEGMQARLLVGELREITGRELDDARVGWAERLLAVRDRRRAPGEGQRPP